MSDKLSLPLIAPLAELPQWQGFRPLDEAEVWTPQGAYNTVEPEAPLVLPSIPFQTPAVAELLAPAGGLEAGYAAFHFGADAIYLGMKKFSARAEAENFTLEELDEITAYAHSLSPRRRVFVTINTLIRQDELAELVEALVGLDEIGVDAVILQDLGVYHALRRYFPKIELHASTQMAVHNRAGAEALKALAFQRVVLARELTFEEVQEITATAKLETEVFIHGALCYSYSGLCLFSAQTLGRSGNRGKCSYSCRDSFQVEGAPLDLRDGSSVKKDPRNGFPFSMKDLALPDHLPALRSAGVSCFKVEGRKKSPLYVATTTDYYRKLLDGNLAEDDRPEMEAELQTVFSRPWTRLFIQSHKDKEVADRDTVGHRGTPVGTIDQVMTLSRHDDRIRFRTRRPLERHDGLQIDLPILGKPFGFAIDHLWIVEGKSRGRESFTAPAGSMVEVMLPPEHPEIPRGAPVYCSSSQAVKQKYRYHRPKPGSHVVRQPLVLNVRLTSDALTVQATVGDLRGTQSLPGPFAPAQDAEKMHEAVHATFSRLGQSRFSLEALHWTNEAKGFVPVSKLNQLRRNIVEEMEKKLAQHREEKVRTLQSIACGNANQPSLARRASEGTPLIGGSSRGDPSLARRANDAGSTTFQWSLKIDRIAYLDAFHADDWQATDEVILDITRDHPATLRQQLDRLAEKIGPDRIRLALPALTRAWEEKAIRGKIDSLRQAGWKKWEAANLSAWAYLGLDPAASNTGDLDIATDWSVYVLNRLAALQMLGMGVTRFALSPEDGFANARSLWREFAEKAVLIVYQDTPLFLAESCAYANLIGGCPGKANCKFESMEMESSHGEKVTAIDYHCRTIVLNQGPFCLAPRLTELAKAGAVSLRADFIYRTYTAEEVAERWRFLRAGKAVPGGHAANWERGLQ